MKIPRHKGRSVALTVLLSMLLAACGGGDEAADDASSETADSAAPEATTSEPDAEPVADGGTDGCATSELVEAAKDEGAVNLYTAWIDAAGENIREDFGEQYGIDVQVLRLSSAAVTQRFSEEAASGVHVADLLATSNSEIFREDESGGDVFVELTDEDYPILAEWPEGFRYPKSMGFTITPMTFIYNPDEVPDGDLPTSWADLADDRWSGLLAASDPRSSNGTAGFYEMMFEQEGEEWFNAMVDNGIAIAEGTTPGAQQVAAGEFAGHLPSNDGATADLTTVDTIEMEYTTGWTVETGLVANAPNPNAAQLLMCWLMMPEGQTALNGDPVNRVSPMYDDIEGSPPLPDGFVPLTPVNDEDRREELANLLGF